MQVYEVKKARSDIYNTNPKTKRKTLVVRKGESYFYLKDKWRGKLSFKHRPNKYVTIMFYKGLNTTTEVELYELREELYPLIDSCKTMSTLRLIIKMLK